MRSPFVIHSLAKARLINASQFAKMHIEGHDIEISSRDKVLFPGSGITKGDIIEYYTRMAEHILPHLRDRPLTLQRFPDGLAEGGFYQKERPDYFPDWIESVTVDKKDGKIEHVLCNDAATLVYLANQATITLHTWLSRIGAVHKPDRMIFDLDPSGDDFDVVVEGARALRKALDKLHIPAYVMTTGSRGLHVMCPLRPTVDFDEVRAFARHLCIRLAEKHPGKFTTEIRKDKRRGRLFLDYLRNAYAQTGVAPYALRAREGAPIATPVEWDEIGRQGFRSQRYNMGNVFRRLGQRGDPWMGSEGKAVDLRGHS